MQRPRISLVCAIGALWIGNAQAQALDITPDRKSITFESHDGPTTISRFANDIMLVKGPINPMVPVAGVTPVGELEVIEALQDAAYIVVDTRTPETQYAGTIPGSVNIPYDEITDRFEELGCRRSPTGWNCEEALNVVLYCNGPNCGQSPRAMAAMIEAGYPPARMYYYRGGMLAWTALGLTTREYETSGID